MCWEEVVKWAGRGLLYADKPTYRKAAPSKSGSNTQKDQVVPTSKPSKPLLTTLL